MNFDYFHIPKWMLQTPRMEKVDGKNVVICLFANFPSSYMVLKLSKKLYCLQFCADFSKEPKSVKRIYLLHLKVLIVLFQKMIKKMLTQHKFDKIL